MDQRPLLLVATDLSNSARAALEAAMDLADRLQGRVLLLHVREPTPTVNPTPISLRRELHEREHANEIARVKEWAAPYSSPDAPFEVRVIDGAAAPGILGVAEEVEPAFVVVGRRGHGKLRQILLGSVAQTVVRSSPRPVIVVPGP